MAYGFMYPFLIAVPPLGEYGIYTFASICIVMHVAVADQNGGVIAAGPDVICAYEVAFVNFCQQYCTDE